MTHIVDMVYFWGHTAPTHPAVIEPAGVVTYAGLASAIEAAAERFSQSIPDRSKPVAVAIPNGLKLLVATLGLLRAGFDAVLVNGSFYGELPGLGVSAMIFERNVPTLEGGNNVPFDDSWLRRGFRVKNSVPLTKTTGGNILFFASDTTGLTKVIVCSQSSWQQRMIFLLNSVYFNYERMLIAPALSDAWGMGRAYEVLHSGQTICLAPPGQPTLLMMNTYDVDTILASPQQILELVEFQEKVTRYPLSSLRAIHVGAASISRASIFRVKKALCQNVIMFYGSTEAGVAALAPYDMIADVPGAVGYIMPGVDVEIVDAANRVLPIGKEGFVRVRSPVFAENMAASQSSDEWFYPGDLGSITEAGMLCIAGRNNDVVNRGGEKLSIVDIEQFLLSCPGVKEAGVCTITGVAGFSEVWVGLVLHPTADMATLRHTLESNAHYKNNIDKIFVVEGIPRGTLGKIQRDEFKKMLQDIAEENGRAGGG